jgi:dienelactone hydrolase
VLRRLVLAALGALALAAPASAFTKEDGVQMMDDGVLLAYTLYTPDGAAPAGGWPGVVVLHGLGSTRGSVGAISTSFVNAGYAVLAYDSRGHGESGGDVTLAGPREVADLRAVRNGFAGRATVSDANVGAWGISYGGGQIWNALAAAVPFAAVEVVETWTSLYDALWPQSLARSGIVAGFANSVAARSPLIATLRDDAVQSTNPAAIRQLTAERSVLPKIRSIRTPVYLFQGRVDFAFDLTQATQAFAGLAGPKKLYVGNFGHPPSTFPGPDIAYVRSQGIAWFDHFLRGKANGVEAKPVVIAKRRSGKVRTELSALPSTELSARDFAGTSTIQGSSLVSRQAPPLPAPLETWGSGAALVRVTKLSSYPRLVVTVLAGNTVVSQGGMRPRVGLNVVRLANYCVFVPKGARLRVTVGPSSPAGQFAYLGFAGPGSATIGLVRLQLPALVKRVSE